MKDHVFEGSDVAAALREASQRLGMPSAALRYVVLQKEAAGRLGMQATPARIAVLLDAHRPAQGPAPRQEAARPSRVPRRETEAAATPGDTLPTDPGARAALVVRRWAEAAGLEVGASVADRDGAVVVQITGRDRAELADGVLDGLAHLLQKTLEGDRDTRRPVVIECSGRRLGRDEALQQQARQVAAAVLSDGQPREIGPLNAYERRLVHMAVRETTGLSSYSVGEGAQRRVTVAPTATGGGPEVM